MKHLKPILISGQLLMGLLVLGFMIMSCETAGALTTPDAPTITAFVNSEAIEWQVEPENAYERLVLVVIGPEDSAFRLIFETNELPYLGLNSIISSGLPDGFYKYELRLIPILTPEAREFITLIREGDNSDLLAEAQNAGLLPTEGSVLAGSFTIDQGVFVLPDAIETFARNDQVVLDDMIVNGSICVGQDCVNGESFGFDTIRLKENNLRIRFVDTSSTSSFPSRDWQITVNDSSNGGLNKFSIDDIDGGRTPFTIEGNAPSHSLYVEDGGRIGLGTSTPVVQLHIKDGNTPTVRLEQDGTSGFTPQTWDVAGNEANFFIRDATNGSTLPLRIFPTAPSNALCIADDGDIGIGTTSPNAKLHIYNTTEDYPCLQVDGNALINGELQLASSRELKTEIHELGVKEAKDAFKQLTPVSFHYKNNLQRRQVGFIAEEVPKIFASRSQKSVNPMDIVAVLTKVMQDQQIVLQDQQKVIIDQKKALQRLDSKLNTLEENISICNF